MDAPADLTLADPKVVGASVQQKAAFLHSKGLSKDEICRAMRSIDPKSPEADQVERGEVALDRPAAAAAPPQPAPPAAPPAPSSAPAPISGPGGVLYYPVAGPNGVVYQPLYKQPAPSSWAMYSIVAAAVVAAGGALAYSYRKYWLDDSAKPGADAAVIPPDEHRETHVIVDRGVGVLPPPPPPPEPVLDAIQELAADSREIKQHLSSISRSLEALSTARPAPIASSSSAPVGLSPAVQALLNNSAAVSEPGALLDAAAAAAAAEPAFNLAAASLEMSDALAELIQDQVAVDVAVPILMIYLRNVEKGERYQRIKLSSDFYEQKVSCFPSAIQFLHAVGFRKQDGWLVWQDSPNPDSQDFLDRRHILSVARERLTQIGETAQRAKEERRDDPDPEPRRAQVEGDPVEEDDAGRSERSDGN